MAKLTTPTPVMVGRSDLVLAYHFTEKISILTSDSFGITSDNATITSENITITNDEMRGFTMPFSPETLEEKPYNICVTCTRIGQTCDGPNFLAMSIERWCEWCHLRKDYLNWRNSTLAEKAAVSKISVDRIMSGDVKDLRITTMQAVTRALVNGSWGQYPCALVAETEKEVYIDNPVLIAQCQHLQDTLDNLSAEYKTEVAAIRQEAQKKIDFLKEQVTVKDKQIEWLHSLIPRNG